MTLRLLIQVSVLALVGLGLVVWVVRHPRDFWR